MFQEDASGCHVRNSKSGSEHVEMGETIGIAQKEEVVEEINLFISLGANLNTVTRNWKRQHDQPNTPSKRRWQVGFVEQRQMQKWRKPGSEEEQANGTMVGDRHGIKGYEADTSK